MGRAKKGREKMKKNSVQDLTGEYLAMEALPKGTQITPSKVKKIFEDQSRIIMEYRGLKLMQEFQRHFDAEAKQRHLYWTIDDYVADFLSRKTSSQKQLIETTLTLGTERGIDWALHTLNGIIKRRKPDRLALLEYAKQKFPNAPEWLHNYLQIITTGNRFEISRIVSVRQSEYISAAYWGGGRTHTWSIITAVVGNKLYRPANFDRIHSPVYLHLVAINMGSVRDWNDFEIADVYSITKKGSNEFMCCSCGHPEHATFTCVCH